jgi:hypothetical protein
MITLGTEKLMSRSEVIERAKLWEKTLGITESDIRFLAVIIDEDSDYIRGALSGRFEVGA